MKKKSTKTVANVVLILIGLTFLVPTVWLVLSSFDSNASALLKWPEWTLENFTYVFSSERNMNSFKNSLIIALSSATISTVLGSVAAYPLSRFRGKYKNAFMLTILLMSTMPMSVAMVPIFKFFVSIGLNDNLGGLILLSGSMAMPYSIWLMRNFFNAVSVDLEEAAWIDGATRLRGMFSVVLPLSASGLASVFIHNFTSAWSGFYSAFILLSTQSKYPASVMLYQFMDEFDTGYGRLAAFAICYTVPAVVLYFFAQKYMSQGFSMQGGVKG